MLRITNQTVWSCNLTETRLELLSPPDHRRRRVTKLQNLFKTLYPIPSILSWTFYKQWERRKEKNQSQTKRDERRSSKKSKVFFVGGLKLKADEDEAKLMAGTGLEKKLIAYCFGEHQTKNGCRACDLWGRVKKLGRQNAKENKRPYKNERDLNWSDHPYIHNPKGAIIIFFVEWTYP